MLATAGFLKMRNKFWSRGVIPLIPLVLIGVVTVVSAITAVLSTTELAKRKQTTSSQATESLVQPLGGGSCIWGSATICEAACKSAHGSSASCVPCLGGGVGGINIDLVYKCIWPDNPPPTQDECTPEGSCCPNDQTCKRVNGILRCAGFSNCVPTPPPANCFPNGHDCGVGAGGLCCNFCNLNTRKCQNAPNTSPPPGGGQGPSPTPTKKPEGGCNHHLASDHWGTNGASCTTEGWAASGDGKVYVFVDDSHKAQPDGVFPANLPGSQYQNNNGFNINLHSMIKDLVKHRIYIKGIDSCGDLKDINNTGKDITCGAVNKPPTCKVAPATNQTVTVGTKRTYTANCLDPDGSVKECRIFYSPRGAAQWSSKTCNAATCSMDITWDKEGSYYVTADTVDDKGQRASGNPWCEWQPNPPSTLNCASINGSVDCGSSDVVLVNVVKQGSTATPGPSSTPKPAQCTPSYLSVAAYAIPDRGMAPLNKVDLKAVVKGSATGNITYKFNCNVSDGIWDKSVTINSNSYTAVDLCNYVQPGHKTAIVSVSRGGCTTTDSVPVGISTELASWPSCSLSPAKNERVAVGTKRTYTANCSDSDGSIKECRVFYSPVGAAKWASKSCTSSPCKFDVTWTTPGKYYVTVDAVDNSGKRSSGNPWCDWAPNPPNTINCTANYNARDCGSSDVYIVEVVAAP